MSHVNRIRTCYQKSLEDRDAVYSTRFVSPSAISPQQSARTPKRYNKHFLTLQQRKAYGEDAVATAGFKKMANSTQQFSSVDRPVTAPDASTKDGTSFRSGDNVTAVDSLHLASKQESIGSEAKPNNLVLAVDVPGRFVVNKNAS